MITEAYRGELGIYLPHEIARNMLASCEVKTGMSLRATDKNTRVLKIVEDTLVDFTDNETIGVQHQGSRVKGYCEEESDVDLLVLHTDVSLSFMNTARTVLDRELQNSEGVSCIHGLDGFIDPDDDMTVYVPNSYEELEYSIARNVNTLIPVLKKGVYFTSAQRLSRAAYIAELMNQFGDADLNQKWKAITDKYNLEYIIGGRDLKSFRDKVSSRFDDFDLTELFWNIIDSDLDEQTKVSLFKPYSIDKKIDYFNYSPEAFSEAVLASIPKYFSQNFFKQRIKLFGYRTSPIEVLSKDIEIIEKQPELKSNIMYECYRSAISKLRR